MSETSDLDPKRLSRIRYQVPDQDRKHGLGTCLGLPDRPPPLFPTAIEGGLFSLVTIVHKHTCLPPLCPSAQEETETGEKMRDWVRNAEHAIRIVSRVSFSFPTCCSLNVIQMSLLNKKYSNPWKNHVFSCVYRTCGGRYQCSRSGGSIIGLLDLRSLILIYGSADLDQCEIPSPQKLETEN